MNEFRIRSTGAILAGESAVKRHVEQETGRFLATLLTVEVLDEVGIDPVMEGAQPTPGQYQSVVRDGVEQNAFGWFKKYVLRDWTQEEIDAYNKSLVPAEVTMRQARLALLDEGLLNSVLPAIDSLPSPHKEKAAIEWEYSQSVQRNRPIVALLAAALSLTDAQLDALFIKAATL